MSSIRPVYKLCLLSLVTSSVIFSCIFISIKAITNKISNNILETKNPNLSHHIIQKEGPSFLVKWVARFVSAFQGAHLLFIWNYRVGPYILSSIINTLAWRAMPCKCVWPFFARTSRWSSVHVYKLKIWFSVLYSM